MTLEIACPNCGTRPHTEFAFGGEERPHGSPDVAADLISMRPPPGNSMRIMVSVISRSPPQRDR